MECQTNTAETAETNQIPIVLNGEERYVPAGLTVDALLAWLKIDPARVAIEVDRQIVRRPDWSSKEIFPATELEIVQFVGGG